VCSPACSALSTLLLWPALSPSKQWQTRRRCWRCPGSHGIRAMRAPISPSQDAGYIQQQTQAPEAARRSSSVFVPRQGNVPHAPWPPNFWHKITCPRPCGKWRADEGSLREPRRGGRRVISCGRCRFAPKTNSAVHRGGPHDAERKSRRAFRTMCTRFLNEDRPLPPCRTLAHLPKTRRSANHGAFPPRQRR